MKSILQNHTQRGVEPSEKVWRLAESNAGPPTTRKAYESRGRVLTQDIKDKWLTQVFNHKTREGVTLVVKYNEPKDWDDVKEVRKLQRSMHGFRRCTQGSDKLLRAAGLAHTALHSNSLPSQDTSSGDYYCEENDESKEKSGRGVTSETGEGYAWNKQEHDDSDLDGVWPIFTTDDELLAMVGDNSEVDNGKDDRSSMDGTD
jgi:hypothetical protein